MLIEFEFPKIQILIPSSTTIAQTDRGPICGAPKKLTENEEIVGLDSWCISIDIWPKSSYMKPICLHDFWRSIHYLISMFRWNMYEYVTFPNLNRFPNQRKSFQQKCKTIRFGKVHDLVLRHPLQFERVFPCVRPWVRWKSAKNPENHPIRCFFLPQAPN